jgi:hypothetical protein
MAGSISSFSTAWIRYGALFGDTRILSKIALMALAWDVVEGITCSGLRWLGICSFCFYIPICVSTGDTACPGVPQRTGSVALILTSMNTH